MLAKMCVLSHLCCRVLGSYDETRLAIEEVLKYAKTNIDKLQAYLHQMLCTCVETSDYANGAVEGTKILNLYGFRFPSKITDACLMKEEMKLKIALKNGSYSCLARLPLIDDPIFWLFAQTQKNAQFSGNQSLLKLLSLKAIQHAIKCGMDRQLPVIVGVFGMLLSQQGKVKLAQELGNVAIALAERISEDKDIHATTHLITHISIVCQLQPFAASIEPLLQGHKDLKLVGNNAEFILGSMLVYFETYFAAGLELGPLLESKLLILEQLCKDLERMGFLVNFQLYRQFALNMRTRSDNPTQFCGNVFHEERALSEMNDKSRKMTVRDSSSMRLQLAFVFGDKECMAEMLTRIQDYPFQGDGTFARLHNRLCFTGLSVFALGKRKDNEPIWKLGKNVSCLLVFRCSKALYHSCSSISGL